MILFTILWYFYNEWWESEKKPEIYTNETKEKFPVWLPSHPPVYENEDRLFSGVRVHRKKAGPTLCGTGSLLLRGKEIKGWAQHGTIKEGR